MSSPENEGCGPFTDPAKNCTLPSGAKNLPGSTPNEVAMDRMIEERYGKATDPMSQMETTGKSTGLGRNKQCP